MLITLPCSMDYFRSDPASLSTQIAEKNRRVVQFTSQHVLVHNSEWAGSGQLAITCCMCNSQKECHAAVAMQYLNSEQCQVQWFVGSEVTTGWSSVMGYAHYQLKHNDWNKWIFTLLTTPLTVITLLPWVSTSGVSRGIHWVAQNPPVKPQTGLRMELQLCKEHHAGFHSAQFSQPHSSLEKRTDVGPDSKSRADFSLA